MRLLKTAFSIAMFPGQKMRSIFGKEMLEKNKNLPYLIRAYVLTRAQFIFEECVQQTIIFVTNANSND